ncbi:MAG: hypothetical protein L6Q98_04105 [Anaerolineae bacterium]|nr:hypothetical protein [Anaerolineae bacterium]
MPPQVKLNRLTDKQLTRLLGAAWDLNAATLQLTRAGLINDGEPINCGDLLTSLMDEAQRRRQESEPAAAGYLQ